MSKAFQGCLVVVGAIILIALLAGMCNGGGDRESPSRQSTPAVSAEDRRKGFHCLSGWDGNHDGLEALVRAELNDPGSMETHETRITPVDANGDHTIIMDFSAKNAFGGRVRHEAVGKVSQATCRATLEFIR